MSKSSNILANNRSVKIVTILFVVYLLFMVGIAFIGKNKLVEYEENEAELKAINLSSTLHNTLAIAKEHINILSENKTLTSYFSNKALGMSLKYGLKANIIKMNKDIKHFVISKKIEEQNIFTELAVFDNENTMISNDVIFDRDILNFLDSNYLEPMILVNHKGDILNVYIMKSIFINDKKVGTILSKLNFKDILNNFILNQKDKPNTYLVFNDNTFNFHDLKKVDFKSSDYIKKRVYDSEFFVILDYLKNASFLSSNIFMFILVIFSALIFIAMYYFFKLNNKNVILKTKIDSAERLTQLLELKIKDKTLQLEELNSQLQQRVEEELNKNKENQSIIYNQSKMAIMGQMLDNIAHQWRQPLSAISTNASFVKVQQELKILDEESISKVMDNIMDSTKFLSETIEDFRSFLRDNKQKEIFNVRDIYFKTKKLLISVTKKSEVQVIENLQDTKINGFPNELVQVLLNIINNAYDEFAKFEYSTKKLIFIDIYEKGEKLYIKIKDSAGGIPENIIDRIFDAHFTTKGKTSGTGIGLYMTKEIVESHLKGTILVSNAKYDYDGESYVGAEFVITLPII